MRKTILMISAVFIIAGCAGVQTDRGAPGMPISGLSWGMAYDDVSRAITASGGADSAEATAVLAGEIAKGLGLDDKIVSSGFSDPLTGAACPVVFGFRKGKLSFIVYMLSLNDKNKTVSFDRIMQPLFVKAHVLASKKYGAADMASGAEFNSIGDRCCRTVYMDKPSNSVKYNCSDTWHAAGMQVQLTADSVGNYVILIYRAI